MVGRIAVQFYHIYTTAFDAHGQLYERSCAEFDPLKLTSVSHGHSTHEKCNFPKC